MKKLLFALIFTFSIFNSQLSIALIARGVGPATAKTTEPGTTCTMTLNGTTAGRMLVIFIHWDTFGSPVRGTVTVSGESNATIVSGAHYANAGAGMTVQGDIAYLANITSGGNKTVTVNFSPAAYANCGVMEYSGQDTASQPDASANMSNNDATGTTSCNTNITTTTGNALIVALCANNGAPTVAAGSTYTLIGSAALPGIGSAYAWMEDKVDAGATGSKAITFTNPYNQSAMAVVTFKVSGGGGGGATPAAVTRRRVQ